VKLKPLREFLKQEVDPEVGRKVSLCGRKGTYTQITEGRDTLD